jgi:hypothetical protein
MRSKRVKLGRKITTNELLLGNSPCRIWSREEVQEKNNQLKIQFLKDKLMKMNAAKNDDYLSIPTLDAA